MTETTRLTVPEADAVVALHTAPRVTRESIEARIASERYVVEGTLTLCILTLDNGWTTTGTSGAASPENFNAEVGRTYARDDAFKKLWPLEGYLLRERLWRQGRSEQRALRG